MAGSQKHKVVLSNIKNSFPKSQPLFKGHQVV